MKLPYKYVQVEFEDGHKPYTYYAPVNMKIEPGDYALVYVVDQPKVVQVTRTSGINALDKLKAHRVIDSVIDNYDKFMEKQARLDEYLELRAKLKEMREQYDELQVLQIMAQNNPEAQELLARITNLNTLEKKDD